VLFLFLSVLLCGSVASVGFSHDHEIDGTKNEHTTYERTIHNLYMKRGYALTQEIWERAVLWHQGTGQRKGTIVGIFWILFFDSSKR
jgi:hypothetical protein